MQPAAASGAGFRNAGSLQVLSLALPHVKDADQIRLLGIKDEQLWQGLRG
jgi:hypothetical protein